MKLLDLGKMETSHMIIAEVKGRHSLNKEWIYGKPGDLAEINIPSAAVVD